MERHMTAAARWVASATAGLLLAMPVAHGDEAGEKEGGSAAHAHCHPAAAAAPAPDVEPGSARYKRSEQRYAVPDVTLVDEAGRPVRLRELLAGDEPVMVNFIFTTCQVICPVMSRIFAGVQRELGPEAARVRLVSISIDPEQDTPERLRAYAARFGAGPGWTFLTGRIQDVVAVERAFDAYLGDKMNHRPVTLLRQGHDRPWVRLDGFASPADLAREYRQQVASR